MNTDRDAMGDGSRATESKPEKHRRRRYVLVALLVLLLGGFLLPGSAIVPVENATTQDWHPDTFWYEPWGESGVHKGIDIFAPHGTGVLAATSGVVIYRGSMRLGGNVIAVLGPKWRVHFYAHLNDIKVETRWVSRGEVIATVGDTGNAKGKPSHLHYTVVSVVPIPWRATTETQGWKRMFYLDPAESFSR